MSTGFADIQGAPLYYEVHGEGYPLLLIHAGVADSRMWDDQIEAFSAHFQVIRFDLRGYGKSHLPAREFTYHDDVKGLLDHLNIRKAHIVGISFGGRTALDFALAYPEYVSALALGAPSVGGNPPSEAVIQFGDQEETLLEKGDLAAASELNVRFWVDGPNRTPEQVNPTVRQRVYQMQYDAFNVPVPDGFAPQGLQPPAIHRLKEIQAPTLVLIGDQDVPFVISTSQKVASEVPDARRVVIQDVAHLLNMEKPAEFNRAVLDFLLPITLEG